MPDDTDRNNSDDEDIFDSVPLGNVFETLSTVLEQLDDMDLDAGERRSDTVRRGNATFDYDISIGTITPDGENQHNRRSLDWNSKGETDDHEYRVRVNEADGEAVVVADLPGVSADQVSVDTTNDGDALEIRVGSETLEPVPLDWGGANVTEVTFTNQVLEIHVESQQSDTTGSENEDGGTNT